METGRYVHAVVDLRHRGWPVATLDCTADPPETIAARIVSFVRHVLTERSLARQSTARGAPPDARRELAEESGIMLTTLGRELWVRESRFHYQGRDHHRIEHVFLGRTPTTAPQVALKPTENEKAGLIERRWWSVDDLRQCRDKLLPATLPDLLDDLLADRLSHTPLTLTD
jgi:hypothetical protein